MKVIAGISGKGGAGKTTLLFNLAQRLHEKGHKTLVLDADPNSSLYMRYERRIDTHESGELKELNFPEVQTFIPSVAKLPRQLSALGERYDVLVVDTFGKIEAFHSSLAHFSDVVIIPTTPDDSSIENAIATAEVMAQVQEGNEGYPLYGIAMLNFSRTGVAERAYRKHFKNEPLFSHETRPCDKYKTANQKGFTTIELLDVLPKAEHTTNVKNATIDMRLLCDQIIQLVEGA